MALTKATYSMIVGAQVNVLDYGADPTGAADSAAAFNAALTAAAGKTLFIPAGTYLINSSLNPIASNGTHIVGDGKLSTIIVFRPSVADSILFDFTAGASLLFYCSVKKLTITNVLNFNPSTYTTARKIAIRVSDVSEFELNEVNISFWTDAAHTSEGLIIRGREFINLTNCGIQADKPVVVDTNPNHPYLAFDACTWTGNFLYGAFNNVDYSPHPCFQVINQGHAMHWTVNGLVMAGEGGGFYYTPDSPGAIAYGWNIHGLHYEQPTATVTSTYGIKVAQTGSPQNVFGVTIEGFTAGSGATHGGIYLRDVQTSRILNCWYGGTGEALFLDGTDGVTNIDNYYIAEAAATVVTTGTFPAGIIRRGASLKNTTAQYVATTLDYKDYHLAQITKNMADASGSQSYTGFGFKPRCVLAFASVNNQANGLSVGGVVFNVGEALAALTYNAEGSVPLAFVEITTGAGNSYTGQIASLDNDGITINWTRTGTPSNSITVTLIAFR